MMKVLKGSCNRCGLCGCLDKSEANGKNWSPGLGFNLFDWDRQHPELGEKIIKSVKKAINWEMGDFKKSGKIDLQHIGKIDFYLSEKGLQTSETDKSCPFFDKNTKDCLIYDTDYYPKICQNTPYSVSKDQTEEWSNNHPSCGFYW